MNVIRQKSLSSERNVGTTTCSWCGAVIPTGTLIQGTHCPKCNGDVRAAATFAPPAAAGNTAAPDSPTKASGTPPWFYARGGQRFGPVTPAELKQLAASNGLSPDDLVWREGMDDWASAGRVQNLFSAASPPPPLPESVNRPEEAANTPDPKTTSAWPPVSPSAAAAPQSPSSVPAGLTGVPEQRKAGLWFYRKGDAVFGPIPEDDLRALRAAGLLRANDEVRREDSEEWTQFDRATSIKQAVASPAAPIPKASSPVIPVVHPVEMRLPSNQPGPAMVMPMHPAALPYASARTSTVDPLPGGVVTVAVLSFVLAGLCLTCGGCGLINVGVMSGGVSGMMGNNIAGRAASAGMTMAQLSLLAHFVFGVVAAAGAIGLLQRAFWGWITALVAGGFSGLLAAYHLVTLVQLYRASQMAPAGAMFGGLQGAAVTGIVMLVIPVLIFGSYCGMAFALLLKREATRIYMRAKR